jgi:hypothetical protein
MPRVTGGVCDEILVMYGGYKQFQIARPAAGSTPADSSPHSTHARARPLPTLSPHHRSHPRAHPTRYQALRTTTHQLGPIDARGSLVTTSADEQAEALRAASRSAPVQSAVSGHSGSCILDTSATGRCRRSKLDVTGRY